MNRPSYRPGVLVLVSLLFLAGGCAKTQGEKMIQTFADTREITTDVRGRVVKTMVSLQQLRTAPGDRIGDAFNRYKDAVEDLEEEDVETRWQATGVKHSAEEHIGAWQKEMETIQDPKIKATLADRQQAVRTNFQLVQMYADDARKRFGPYLLGNKELVKAAGLKFG